MKVLKCSKCNKRTKHELTSEGYGGREWMQDYTCNECGEHHCRVSNNIPEQQTQYFVLSTPSDVYPESY